MPPHFEDLADTQNARLALSLGAEDFSLKASGFFNRAANHFIYKDNTFDMRRRKTHNETYDGGAGLWATFKLPRYAKLSAAVDGYSGTKNFPQGGEEYGIQEDFSIRESVMLDAPVVWSEKLSTEASVTHTYQSLEYTQSSRSHFGLHTVTAINRWGWFPNTAFTLRTGGDWRLTYLDSNTMGQRLRQDGGVYVTGEIAPHAAVLIIPSCKVILCGSDDDTEHSVRQLAAVVPKLGFALHPASFLTLKNNYFRSFKFPDFEDLYWAPGNGFAGNPALKPEDGWGADLGAAYTHRLFSLDGTVFAQWTRDSIHWSQGGDSVWRPYNVGEAAYFGLNAKIAFDIPLGNGVFRALKPSASYQFMRSYLLSYGYTWESEKRIPYMPEHTIDLSLDLRWSSGSAVLSARYETLRYGNTGNTTELPAYFLLNLTVNQNINANFALFAALRNMTNTSYQSYHEYPMPGLVMTLGVQFNIHTKKENEE
ncbi:MAG: TonB-dependent receptor [Spirochaetaceae bacterium]|nr:TonB-dependent receptor [Spirochaetaceae bacterium]